MAVNRASIPREVDFEKMNTFGDNLLINNQSVITN